MTGGGDKGRRTRLRKREMSKSGKESKPATGLKEYAVSLQGTTKGQQLCPSKVTATLGLPKGTTADHL